MDLFSYVKTKISIVDVINEYTSLKRAGLYWKAHCPFHQEKSASFTVSPHKEIFYCFGCHVSGDSISFIARMENCSQLEAAKLLAERYHLELPQELSLHNADYGTKKRDNYYDLCMAIALWCHEQLAKHASVLAYLKIRSITQESIDQFKLGYFPGGLRSIKAFLYSLQEKHIIAKDLVDAHILQEGQRGILYSSFEERIIFPIKDHLGRCCGFGGRTFKAEDARSKYYNSREGAYFSKGSLLFGLDVAKRHIQMAEELFLVEGYVDCIAMVQSGYPNTVATLGTACTVEHLGQLARYGNVVYVLYDGDQAGKHAMMRLADLCWQTSLELRVVNLPEGHDPASLLSEGCDLSPLIAKARDIASFFVSTLGVDFSNKPLQEKMHLVKRIVQMLQRIEDALKQDLLIQQAAQVLAIPFQTLKREVLRTYKESLKRSSVEKVELHEVPESEPSRMEEQLTKLEKRIFFAIMNNIQLFNGDNEDYLIKYFCEPLRAILMLLQKERARVPAIDFVQFFDTLSPEQQHLITKILLEQEDQVSAETFRQLFAQFQKRVWKMATRTIAVQLDAAKKNNNQGDVKRLLQEFLELKRNMVHKNTI